MTSGGGRQTRLAVGCCDHRRTEDVKTYGGTVIAIRCKGCTNIVCEIGDCDGCGKVGVKLTKTVSRSKERFCTDDCWKNTTAERRKAARAVVAPAGERK